VAGWLGSHNGGGGSEARGTRVGCNDTRRSKSRCGHVGDNARPHVLWGTTSPHPHQLVRRRRAQRTRGRALSRGLGVQPLRRPRWHLRVCLRERAAARSLGEPDKSYVNGESLRQPVKRRGGRRRGSRLPGANPVKARFRTPLADRKMPRVTGIIRRRVKTACRCCFDPAGLGTCRGCWFTLPSSLATFDAARWTVSPTPVCRVPSWSLSGGSGAGVTGYRPGSSVGQRQGR
jgi:hypothetical protein